MDGWIDDNDDGAKDGGWMDGWIDDGGDDHDGWMGGWVDDDDGGLMERWMD